MISVNYALELAIDIHGKQVDKAGRPYLGHLVRVMARLPADATDLERKTALLHDAIEDHGGAAQDLLIRAGAEPELMEMLDAITWRQSETHEDYLVRVARSPAWRVKLADIADNSDPSRLALLDENTAARLAEKYAKAIKIINEERA